MICAGVCHKGQRAAKLPRCLAPSGLDLVPLGVGGLLAVAGVLLQALFRNPLAEPFVLGVSGGAAIGALLAMIVSAPVATTQFGAVAGALAAVAIVYFLARSGGTARLLMTGVVIASGCGALISEMLAVADASRVRSMVFWLAGDLGWAPSPTDSVFSVIV